MTTKERLFNEIDRLPPDILGEVLKYIKSIKARIASKKRIPTFKLKGQFDDIDIRKRAYE
ncbi:MAG: hypothetical protein HQM10_24230 [Candidatus Riflebacteria bacterium]|nr:hypothetical protein [Candidatus Riflebacteria bacterium]